jgi:hypothetical protein
MLPLTALPASAELQVSPQKMFSAVVDGLPERRNPRVALPSSAGVRRYW